MNIIREEVDLKLTKDEVETFKKLSAICYAMKDYMLENTKEEERGYSFDTAFDYLSNIESAIDDFLIFMNEKREVV